MVAHPALLIAGSVITVAAVGFALNEFVIQPWREEHAFHSNSGSSSSFGDRHRQAGQRAGENLRELWNRIASSNDQDDVADDSPEGRRKRRLFKKRHGDALAEEVAARELDAAADEKAHTTGVSSAVEKTGLRQRKGRTASGSTLPGPSDEKRPIQVDDVELETLPGSRVHIPDDLLAPSLPSSQIIFSLSPDLPPASLPDRPAQPAAVVSDFSDAFVRPFDAAPASHGQVGSGHLDVPVASVQSSPAASSNAPLPVDNVAVPGLSPFTPGGFSNASTDPFSDAFRSPRPDQRGPNELESDPYEMLSDSDSEEDASSQAASAGPATGPAASSRTDEDHLWESAHDSSVLIFPLAPSNLSQPPTSPSVAPTSPSVGVRRRFPSNRPQQGSRAASVHTLDEAEDALSMRDPEGKGLISEAGWSDLGGGGTESVSSAAGLTADEGGEEDEEEDLWRSARGVVASGATKQVA